MSQMHACWKGGSGTYMEPKQQPRQEKCCAVNKRHVEMEITVCAASIPRLSDTKQPVLLHLNCWRWHFAVGTCHLEEVLHMAGQGRVQWKEFLRDRLPGVKNSS